MSRHRAIGRRFGAAAAGYEQAAPLQRLVATRLADRIASAVPDARTAELRILEIGCGTGLLTHALRQRLPRAFIIATDLAPEMVAACRAALGPDDRLHTLAMDASSPAVSGGFDLICSSLAMQWFDDPVATLSGLRRLLSPGGRLCVSTLLAGTLAEWQASHHAEGASARGLDYLPLDRLRDRCGGDWDAEAIGIVHRDGLDFLHALRRIGAHQPAAGSRPLDPGTMRRVLRRFETDHGSIASYRVGYGAIVTPARRGVFVTGTDTGIGKTLVSACLVRAWQAEYWKPLQTGLDNDPGDSATVLHLAGCGEARIHPPAVALRAALSPADAASLEGVAIDPDELRLPAAGPDDPPLVVEGAGGVLVPVAGGLMIADLIVRLGLPVLLVARSTLGTINHTLLSLEALRRRGIAVAGVILSGPPSPGNRLAIERHGRIRVLAELPALDLIDHAAINRFAAMMPTLAAVERPPGDGQ